MFTRNGNSEVSNIKRRGAVKVKRPADHSDMSRGDTDLRDDPQTEDSINQGSNSDMDVQEEESGPESDEETFEISEDDEETRAHLELAEKIVKANSERKPSLVYKQVTHLIEDGDGNVTADSENNCVSEREVTYILEDHSGCAVANVIDSDDDEQALKEAGLRPPRRRDLNDSGDDSAVTDEELMSVQSEDVASHSRSRNASRKMQKIPIIVRHEDSDSDTEDLLRPMNATKPRIVSLLVPDDDESLLTDREDVEVSEDESVPCREPEEVEAKQKWTEEDEHGDFEHVIEQTAVCVTSSSSIEHRTFEQTAIEKRAEDKEDEAAPFQDKKEYFKQLSTEAATAPQPGRTPPARKSSKTLEEQRRASRDFDAEGEIVEEIDSFSNRRQFFEKSVSIESQESNSSGRKKQLAQVIVDNVQDMAKEKVATMSTGPSSNQSRSQPPEKPARRSVRGEVDACASDTDDELSEIMSHVKEEIERSKLEAALLAAREMAEDIQVQIEEMNNEEELELCSKDTVPPQLETLVRRGVSDLPALRGQSSSSSQRRDFVERLMVRTEDDVVLDDVKLKRMSELSFGIGEDEAEFARLLVRSPAEMDLNFHDDRVYFKEWYAGKGQEGSNFGQVAAEMSPRTPLPSRSPRSMTPKATTPRAGTPTNLEQFTVTNFTGKADTTNELKPNSGNGGLLHHSTICTRDGRRYSILSFEHVLELLRMETSEKEFSILTKAFEIARKHGLKLGPTSQTVDSLLTRLRRSSLTKEPNRVLTLSDAYVLASELEIRFDLSEPFKPVDLITEGTETTGLEVAVAVQTEKSTFSDSRFSVVECASVITEIQCPVMPPKRPPRKASVIEDSCYMTSDSEIDPSEDMSTMSSVDLECDNVIAASSMAISTGLMALITGEMAIQSGDMALTAGDIAIQAGRAILGQSLPGPQFAARMSIDEGIGLSRKIERSVKCPDIRLLEVSQSSDPDADSEDVDHLIAQLEKELEKAQLSACLLGAAAAANVIGMQVDQVNCMSTSESVTDTVTESEPETLREQDVLRLQSHEKVKQLEERLKRLKSGRKVTIIDQPTRIKHLSSLEMASETENETLAVECSSP
ncbi:hypothetical protein HDE_07624 [Halotydeus destructor]|nr:hypothetical protein HDE_07624 [Halotydeus destructor]